MAKVANTSSILDFGDRSTVLASFNTWRTNTNEANDRLNSITQNFMNNRITLTGNVEVNTTDFVVDTTTNRVGVGTANPTALLEVAGLLKVQDIEILGQSISAFNSNTIYANTIGINTASPTAPLHVYSSFAYPNDTVLIENTEPAGSQGPTLTLWRNSASPENNDNLGAIQFDGENSGGGASTYASVYGKIYDKSTVTGVDGYLVGAVIDTNVSTEVVKIRPSQTNIRYDTYIGNIDTSPSAPLHVYDTTAYSGLTSGIGLLELNSPGTGTGPMLSFHRSDTPTGGIRAIGGLEFVGPDGAGTDVGYAYIYAFQRDYPAGAEDGYIDIRAMDNGTLKSFASFGNSQGLWPMVNLLYPTTIDPSGTVSSAAHNNPLIVRNDDVSLDTTILWLDDDSDSLGPLLDLRRNNYVSVAPDNNDGLGRVGFSGENSASSNKTYAHISAYSTNVASGSEQGEIALSTMEGGSASSKFVVTGSNKTNILNDTYIGSASTTPSAPLHVYDTTGAPTNGNVLIELDGPQTGAGGPYLILDRSNTPFAGVGTIGAIFFRGRNSTDGVHNYAQIDAVNRSQVPGEEIGYMRFGTSDAGAYVSMINVGNYSDSTIIHNRVDTLVGGLVNQVPDAVLHTVDNTNGSTPGLIIGNEDTTPGTNQTIDLWFGLSRNSGTVKNNAGSIRVGKELDWTVDDNNIDAYMAFNLYENNASSEKMRLSSTGYLGIGTTAPAAPLHVYDTAAGAVDTVLIESTEAGASGGPKLNLWRNSASPADSDDISYIEFNGENSANERTRYAYIGTTINDVTDTTEDGELRFFLLSGGSNTEAFVLNQTRTNILNDTYIGSAVTAPSAPLHVYEPLSTSGYGTIQLENDSTSGSGAPALTFFLNEEPSTNWSTGTIEFVSKNNAPSNLTYGRIQSVVRSTVAGAEDSVIDTWVRSNNTFKHVQRISGETSGVSIADSLHVGYIINTVTSPLNVYDTLSNTTTAQINVNNNDAQAGPILTLYRSMSVSPDPDDDYGMIRFLGADTGLSSAEYGNILQRPITVTAGLMDGRMVVSHQVGGSSTEEFITSGYSNRFNSDMYIGGVGTAPSAPLHVYDTTADVAVVQIELDNDTPTTGPELLLYKNSNPGVNGNMGAIMFGMNNAASAYREGGSIKSGIQNAAVGAEDVSYVINSYIDGTATDYWGWNSGGSTFTSALHDMYIGQYNVAPAAPLHVYDTATSAPTVYVDLNNAVGSGPTLSLVRTNTYPGGNMQLGRIKVTGKNISGIYHDFNILDSLITNGTHDAEDSAWRFYNSVDGVLTAGLSVGNPTNPDNLNIVYDTYIGSATTAPSAPLHVYDTTVASSQVIIQTDENSATAGPYLQLYRNSTSPTASDNLGSIQFYGEDSASNKNVYSVIETSIEDPTSASEDAALALRTVVAGSAPIDQLYINSTRTNILNDTYIGSASTAPSAPLHVYDDTAVAPNAHLLLENTEDTATVGPLLELWRNRANRADDDNIGAIYFTGENSASAKINYVRFNARIDDITAGTEDSHLRVWNYAGGTATEQIEIRPTYNGFLSDTFIGAISPPSAPLHVYDTAAGVDTVLIESTDTGTSGAPWLTLYRNSASPADDDAMGTINFAGKNFTAGDKIIYAYIYGRAEDVTDGEEDGAVVIVNEQAGATSVVADFGPTDNNLLHDLYIGNGSTAPSAPLHVYDTVAAVDTVLIEVEEASVNTGPLLTLFKNSSSIAVSDSLGRIVFRGQNNEATAPTDYTIISTNITNATSGTEAGELLFTTRTTDTLTTQFKLGQGFYATSAGSGDMGDGTVNAKAVYDDGAGPLTDYVLDYAVDGFIDYDWYDNDEFGSAKAREWNPDDLNLDTYVSKWKARKTLPPFQTKEERQENGRQGIGSMVQGLMETVEVMAAHISQLNDRIKELENKISH